MAGVAARLLQEGHGHDLTERAQVLASAWRDVPASIHADVPRHRATLVDAIGSNRANLWIEAAQHARSGSWEPVIVALASINALTMAGRGGARWMEVVDGGLRVTMAKGAGLADQAALLEGWRNPYFFTPVWSLQNDLEPVA